MSVTTVMRVGRAVKDDNQYSVGVSNGYTSTMYVMLLILSIICLVFRL